MPFSLDEIGDIVATVRADYRPLLHHPFFTGLRSRESANKYPKNKNDNFSHLISMGYQ